MTQPTIAIVGAGLSGLTLSRILQRHGIDSSVYESDTTRDARRQGGSLDIHEDSGQIALRDAGLHEEFHRHTHPQGERVRVLDKTGRVHIDGGPEGGAGGRPEIDRTRLRDLLIDSLAPGRISWGRKATSVRTLPDGRHEVAFADGTSTTADLLVGADGTWSKVRPLLSPAVPAYSGITHLEIRVHDARMRYPHLAAVVGTGMVFALSDNKGILGHGGQHLELGVSLRVPHNWLSASGIDWSNPDAARAGLLVQFGDWSPELTDLIRHCDDVITPRQIFALPAGHHWERVPGATLVGDAAHVMPPYAGEGANAALLDAAELASAIIENGDDTEKALIRYESEMFPRARAAAEMSVQGLDACFDTEAPRQITALFSGTGSLGSAEESER